MCPVSDVPFNGLYKFFIHKASGWVISEKAIKEVPIAVQEIIDSRILMSEFI